MTCFCSSPYQLVTYKIGAQLRKQEDFLSAENEHKKTNNNFTYDIQCILDHF